MRTFKTAFAAASCVFIYYSIDRNPTFACIGAVFGMGSSLGDSIQGGGNRAIGTAIGGLIGMMLFGLYLHFFPDGKHTVYLAFFTFTGIILLILCCRKLWLGGIQPGSVVLCILLFNTPPETYISYSLNRILDTIIGVFIAIIVNLLLPGGASGKDFFFNHSAFGKIISGHSKSEDNDAEADMT